MGTADNVPLTIELQASLDPGFVGHYTEEGRDGKSKHQFQIHLHFGKDSILEGAGSDASGHFVIERGQYSAVDVAFTTRYLSGNNASRKFTGQRYPTMSIAGRWTEDGASAYGMTAYGEFAICHSQSEHRFAPSYDINRVKMYNVLEQLATGGFGVVSRVRRVTDGRILVWKELNYSRMNKKERRMMITEVNILRDVEHPNIVKYFDTIIIREQQKIYIVIEHCSRGDIGAMIEKYKRQRRVVDERFIWRVMSQILQALHTCHNREEVILHRDLKPANILLDHDYNVKVADFGLACVVSSDTLACSKVGTPLYMSPEQIQGSGYTERSDIWSLGCIVYEMAALKPPFDARNQMELSAAIHRGRFDPIPGEFSQELHSVVRWALQLQAELRPSVDELLKYAESKANPQPGAAPQVVASPRQLEPTMGGTNNVTTPHRGSAPSPRGGTASTPLAAAAASPRGQPAPLPADGRDFAGMVVEVDAVGRCFVAGVAKDSPAERSTQVQVGDELIKIDGRELQGRSLETIKEWMAPPRQSNLALHPVCVQLSRMGAAGTLETHQATLFVDTNASSAASPVGTPGAMLAKRGSITPRGEVDGVGQRASPTTAVNQQFLPRAGGQHGGAVAVSPTAPPERRRSNDSGGVRSTRSSHEKIGSGDHGHQWQEAAHEANQRNLLLEQKLSMSQKEVADLRRTVEELRGVVSTQEAALERSRAREKELVALSERQREAMERLKKDSAEQTVAADAAAVPLANPSYPVAPARASVEQQRRPAYEQQQQPTGGYQYPQSPRQQQWQQQQHQQHSSPLQFEGTPPPPHLDAPRADAGPGTPRSGYSNAQTPQQALPQHQSPRVGVQPSPPQLLPHPAMSTAAPSRFAASPSPHQQQQRQGLGGDPGTPRYSGGAGLYSVNGSGVHGGDNTPGKLPAQSPRGVYPMQQPQHQSFTPRGGEAGSYTPRGEGGGAHGQLTPRGEAGHQYTPRSGGGGMSNAVRGIYAAQSALANYGGEPEPQRYSAGGQMNGGGGSYANNMNFSSGQGASTPRGTQLYASPYANSNGRPGWQ